MEKTSTGYVEAYMILNLLSKEMRNKIPTKVLNKIESNKNKEIKKISLDSLEDYKISNEANKILAVIYKNYFATEEEKKIIANKEKIIIEKENKKREFVENKKREMYNPDNLFKNKTAPSREENIALVEVKKEKWYEKVFSFFRRIFKK